MTTSRQLLIVFAGFLGACLFGCSQNGSAAGSQQAFNSPESAAEALVAAVRVNDPKQIQEVLGSEGEDIAYSGDATADTRRREIFLGLYDQKHTLTREDPESVMLVVGNSEWPFPVPIVWSSDGWVFDTMAGKEEILNRRIGRNELSAMEVCKAIADAQQEYALEDPDGDGVHEYAQKFASDPGQRNGLFWPTSEGEQLSPLGLFAARAAAEGYRRIATGPTPYHGYYYRILRTQGPNAPGGALQYVLDGDMSLGYAVLGCPAEYGNSGVMTFVMGPDGKVYQKDLGPDTLEASGRIEAFDPDSSWSQAQQTVVMAHP